MESRQCFGRRTVYASSAHHTTFFDYSDPVMSRGSLKDRLWVWKLGRWGVSQIQVKLVRPVWISVHVWKGLYMYGWALSQVFKISVWFPLFPTHSLCSSTIFFCHYVKSTRISKSYFCLLHSLYCGALYFLMCEVLTWRESTYTDFTDIIIQQLEVNSYINQPPIDSYSF